MHAFLGSRPSWRRSIMPRFGAYRDTFRSVPPCQPMPMQHRRHVFVLALHGLAAWSAPKPAVAEIRCALHSMHVLLCPSSEHPSPNLQHRCGCSEPWEKVTTAHWKKYPNPLSSHVLSADTLHRFVPHPHPLEDLRRHLKLLRTSPLYRELTPTFSPRPVYTGMLIP